MNADAEYTTALINAETELRRLFQHTSSCLAIGAGYGQREIEFVKRFMTNIESLTAVEPAADCAAGLTAALQEHLPKVHSVVHQEKIQSWKGVGEAVDAVLMLHVLHYLTHDERCALMGRLFNEKVSKCFFYIFNEIPMEKSCLQNTDKKS